MNSLIERLTHALTQDFEPFLPGDSDGRGGFGGDAGVLVPAAVLVPVVRRPQPGLLLTTRTAHLRNHAGQVAFPGGRIDHEDADHVAAALREANEEIGLPRSAVKVLGTSSTYRTGTGYCIRPVVGVIDPDIPLSLNPDEVSDVFEIPLAIVLDPANHIPREVEWQGRLRRFYAIEWQGRTIWGATAGILVNLAARLR